jgi:hypothetical protein
MELSSSEAASRLGTQELAIIILRKPKVHYSPRPEPDESSPEHPISTSTNYFWWLANLLTN